MPTLSPVEHTNQYATTVSSLSDAWAFVMEYVDRVGPNPQVHISPFWRISTEEEDSQGFEVSVNGMVHEA